MLDAEDAHDLVSEAIERADDERDASESGERRFRNRVSLLVAIFAVSLAIVHMAAAGAARDSLLKGIEASDSFAYMQAKILRETVYKTAARTLTVSGSDQADWAREAARLRAPDAAGHGIGQLEAKGSALRREGRAASTAGENFELGETALQIAIVLLSIALIAQSRQIVVGACVLGCIGIALAAATAGGYALPWTL